MALDDGEVASPSEEVVVVTGRDELGPEFRAVGVRNKGTICFVPSEPGEQTGPRAQALRGVVGPAGPPDDSSGLGCFLTPLVLGAACTRGSGCAGALAPGGPGVNGSSPL